MNVCGPKTTRRQVLAAFTSIPLAGGLARGVPANAQTPAGLVESVTIDLPSAPESIDPALAYSPRDWSIVHSIYDALVQFDDNGQLVPLAAESFTTEDAVTFHVRLRGGLAFHDGSPVTAEAIKRSVAYMLASGSSAVDLFKAIDRVDVKDDLTADIVCTAPSPWLPAQLAAWIVLIPEGMTPETAVTAPVGSGPYRFERYDAGAEIVLMRNEQYTWDSPKGRPLAERVQVRFVPEPATRVANIASGDASLITEVPNDQWEAVKQSGAQLLSSPIVGIAYLRVAADVEPFTDARVRQALNYAVDVQQIATSLVGEGAHRLASIYPDERTLGFDPDLAPYPYDPEKAMALLAEAGHGEGFATQLEMTSTARLDIAQAIAEQLADVGVKVELVTSDYATFNAGWTDKSRPPLRLVTWSPLYDPHTLLRLVFATGGYLSRYSNPKVDEAFAAASIEPDASKRARYLLQVGAALHDDPACIYLWNLLASYGVGEQMADWQPRGDEYVIATSRQAVQGAAGSPPRRSVAG